MNRTIVTCLVAIAMAAIAGCQRDAPDAVFTLETSIDGRGLAFVGKGGPIDGVRNPDLHVPEGALVRIVLVNGDGINHDITIPELRAASRQVQARGSQRELVFRATRKGRFAYYCSRPGHRDGGMEGEIVVG